MEYYFSDRKFNIIGVARTTGKGEWLVSADSEVKTTDDRPAIALTLTIPFKTNQEQAIDEMAAENNFVLYQDEEGNGHQMVIASVTNDTLAHIHTVVCTDAGNDLMNEVVGAYKADKAYTIADYILMFTNDSGWEIGINEFPTDVRTLTWTDEDTSLSRIKSVAKDFDAVLSFGFVFVGTTAVKRVINIRHEETSDSLISFEMNKDINNIVKTVDIYDMETSVKAYGATPDGSNDPINLIGYQWKDPNGQFVLDQYGFLHDTIAVQKYSRLLSNSNPNPTQSDWNRVKTFDSKSQATLLQAALADLKKYNHPNVNYEVDLASAPYVPLNQTVHIVDENQNLFLSAKVLSVERSRAGHYTKLTLGDYANEQPNLYSALKDMAVKIENIPKAIQFYPWIRYADDDKGTNMSAFPSGKKYMAIVPNAKSSIPSDNPADYAGHWALIQGKDGANGVPGEKGADGRTSYFHTAWSNSADGTLDFNPDYKSAVGLDILNVTSWAKNTSMSNSTYKFVSNADSSFKVTGKGTGGYEVLSKSFPAKVGDKLRFTVHYTNRLAFGLYNGYGLQFVVNNEYTESVTSTSKIVLPNTITRSTEYQLEYTATTNNVWMQLNFGGVADSSQVDFDVKIEVENLTNPVKYTYMGTYSDFTQADSNNPSDYNWALFKGEDGDVGPKGEDGLPGKPGADGRTAYAHFAYADIKYICTENSDFTLSEASLVRLGSDSRWVYKEFQAGTYTADTALWGQGDPAVGVVKNAELVSDFSTTDSNRTYIGFYSDFSSGDSMNPSDYNWSLIKGADGADGKDGVPGKPGADGKTPYFHIAYADSSNGRTNFSLDTPGSRKYIGSYTDFTQADSTNPAVYSWQLVQGPQGERGKQIFKSSFEDGPNDIGRWWSDLSPAPSVDNPPKIGDTVITPSGNIFQIDTVNVGGGGGGGTFGVGDVLGNIRGPQGPQGPQGVPGSKDVPYTYIQLGTPTSPKKGDLWWHGTTLNDATALQYYNGSTWIDQSIQQAVLSIKKLQSIEIDTSTINSPDINSPFSHVQIDGAKSSGNLELKDANLSILGNIEDNNGNPNGQYYKSLLSPSGMFNYITTPDRQGSVSSVALQRGALQLQTLIGDPSAATKKYIQSEFTSKDNVTFFHVDTTPAKNIDIDWAYIYYTRRGNLVTVNFQFHTIANQYNYLRLADIRPGYTPYLKDKIVASCSNFSNPSSSSAIYSSTPRGGTVGWYGALTHDFGSWGGSVSYLTLDDYPTGDTFFN